MKKVFAMALCVLMIAGMMTIGASAANSIEIAVGTASANVGDEVEVTIEMPKNEGIIAAALVVEYDTDALELVKSVDGGLISGPIFPNAENDPYVLLWNSGEQNDSTATGTLATLTFKVKDAAVNGDYEIGLSILDNDPNNCYDVNLDNVEMTLTAGKITVSGGADAPATDAPATDAATDAPATNAATNAPATNAATTAASTTASSNKDGDENSPVLPIIIALVAVAVIAVVVVIVLKKKKASK